MLSDVMKQVVQEILQGNKKIISKKVDHKTGIHGTDDSLKSIKRPNYQRLKKDQRLSIHKTNIENASIHKKPAEQKENSTLLSKQFNEESIAALHSLSLAQGKVPKKSNTYTQVDRTQKKMAKIIGHTRNGGCVWFYPDLPKELMGSFHRPLNSSSVGVVKMPECLPSYLLMVNEIMRNNQGIKFHLTWNKEEGAPFTAELYDEDTGRLEEIMNDMYQKINRRSLKRYETCTVVSPGTWLSSQLNISSPVDAIAFLEGVPYYTSIVLMEVLLQEFENSDFNYEINGNYLLLKGNYHVISKLVTELKIHVQKGG